jgi:hydrophobic/amphiphilic exporter-1 (mainly G- bacteria), HAE1 family
VRLIRWSIDHCWAVLAFYACIIGLAGLALWSWIPVRLTPEVRTPQLAVLSENLALSALEVERLVTTPTEHKLAGVPGVRSIRSQSMPNTSVILLEYPYGTDMDKAQVAVQAVLPRQARVLPVEPLNLPVVSFAVRSPGMGPAALRRHLEEQVLPRLRLLPSVDGAYIVGSEAQKQLLFDRDRLARKGLSLPEVARALEAAYPSGTLGEFRAATGNTLEAHWAETDPGRLLETPVGPGTSLGDVAGLQWGPRHESAAYRFNGRDCLALNVVQRPGASAPATVSEVRRLLATTEGFEWEEAFNNARFVRTFELNCWRELLLAAVLAGAVVFGFLRDGRGTLAILATVPASLAVAVLGFVALGISLNSSSLIGLVLAVGRVVDDTIIDLHAVSRHRARGKEPAEAAVDGCWEVRRAVFSSTWVMVFAMLPLTFAGGLTQDMFLGICWPLLLALLASLLVSLTLTPVLAALLYRGVEVARGRAERTLEDSYRRSLSWALRNRGFVITLAGAACYLAWSLYPLLGSEMMPLADTGQLFVQLESKPGMSPAETLRQVEKVEQILLRQPEVLGVAAEVGMASGRPYFTGYDMQGPQGASLWVTLKDKQRRKRTIWQVSDAVYAEAMGTVSGLRRLFLRESGSDVMASPMPPVQLVLRGPDLQRLSWLAEQSCAVGKDVPGLFQPSSAWTVRPDSWEVRPRLDAVARLGLTPVEVAQQARMALGGGTAGGLVLAYAHEQRRHLADMLQVNIVGRNGVRCPLSSLVDLGPGSATDLIEHDGLRRSNSVGGAYRNGGPGSMNVAMNWQMSVQNQVPFPAGYSIEQRGDMPLMMDSTRRLWRGLGLAVALIYVSLALHFACWRTPLVILATIPLELLGVFGALLIAGQTISSVSLLGLVVLHGMDATAAILLLDAVNRERRAGANLESALLRGAPSRLRPVLMTVAVTLAVMLPIALVPGTGLDAYSPLATVIVGGLSLTTILTLWVVPVLLSFIPGGGNTAKPSETGSSI